MPSKLGHLLLCCHSNPTEHNNILLILLYVKIPFQIGIVCLCFGNLLTSQSAINLILWLLLAEGRGAMVHTAVPQEGDPDLCGKTASIMVTSTLH